ncbi:MAG TPA: SBBP repeat-containing protein, partial [Verrucomicrobiae bacterium]|nr:SBBP repeat-containing protein [Verrucomicrobiae bacterium]
MKKILSLKPILVGLICAGMFHFWTPVVRAQSSAAFANLPLYFEAGPAPAAGPARFITRGCNYQFLLSPAEVQITLGKTGVKPAEVRMDFTGSNPGAQMSGDAELSGKVNYLMGNDPAAWRSGVPTFARVRVGQLYPGVNLVYYGNQRQLEYDFTLAPGTDPDMIKIHFDGVDKISIGGQGELILALGRDEIHQPGPVIYQTVAGRRQAVVGGYRLINKHTVAFTIGKYDHRLPLVIDPILSFSTYFGGNSGDAAWSIALDTNGFVYIAGQTLSKQFYNSPGAFQTNFAGGGTTGDAFVAKLTTNGQSLVYFTYLGGSVDDVALCMTVDNAGNAFVGGYTDSANFPVTPGAFSTNISGIPDRFVHLYPVDGFVTELNPGGSNLVYSTYLGGGQADGVYGIAVDSADNAYVTGFTCSTNFPTTNALPFQLAGTTNSLLNHLACPYSYYFNNNAFVTEIASSGTALKFSSYLGGTNYDWGNSIAVDSSNYIYVTGFSASTNFPTTNALQQQFVYVTPTNAVSTNQIFTTNFSNGYLLNGSSNLTSAYDAFVTKLAPGGTGWVYSTFLGGTNNDIANHIAADGAGNAYVTGWTVSTNFPNTVTNVAGLYNGLANNTALASPLITNAFLTQITWSGSNAAIGYSAVFGGTNFGGDVGYGVTVDPSGNVFVVGASTSTNFPAINTPGLFGATNAGGSDVFVIAFNTNASAVLYSGYLGGSGNDYGYG